MSLVAHAETELKAAGLFDQDSDYSGMLGEAVLELVKVFADQGHSGFSAHQTLRIFQRVASFKPLVPITDNPDDWMEVGENTWQCRRQSELFSEDGGKTYHSINENRLPEWMRHHAPGFMWSSVRWLNTINHKAKPSRQ